jgi:glycogen(starch) synthase
MKIIMSSHSFWPRLGGIERVGSVVASGLAKRGHEVRVITNQRMLPGFDEGFHAGVEVLRCPEVGEIIASIRWADVLLQNNISVKPLLVSAFFGMPSLVTYHTWIDRRGHASQRAFWAKKAVGHLATKQLAVSAALAAGVAPSCRVISNPYDEAVFRVRGEKSPNSILFAGRITKDKGLEFLVRAMEALCCTQPQLVLRIVGEGEDMPRIFALVDQLGLKGRVTFVGALDAERTAEEMARAHLLVVPSVWEEPFGLVAIEGLASGCHVVASHVGGLPEALGGFGHLVAAGSVEALVAGLSSALQLPPRTSDALFPNGLKVHLRRYQTDAVLAEYECHLMDCMARRRAGFRVRVGL